MFVEEDVGGYLLAFIALTAPSFGQVAPQRPHGPMSAAAADTALRDYRWRRLNLQAWSFADAARMRKVWIASDTDLIGYLDGRDKALRYEAAIEAGARKRAVFIPPLRRIVESSEGKAPRRTHLDARAMGVPEPGLPAVEALKRIGTASAREALRLALHRSGLGLDAAMALAEMGDPSGKAILVAALGRRASPALRIGRDLLALGFGRRPNELKKLLRGMGNDKRLLLPDLAKKDWPEVVPELRRILNDRKEYHGSRKWAAIALGGLRHRPSIPDLIAALRDPVPSVREAAATALGQIGDRSAIAALRLAMGGVPVPKKTYLGVEPIDDARRAAERAIDILSGPPPRVR